MRFCENYIFGRCNFDISIRGKENGNCVTEALKQSSIISNVFLGNGVMVCLMNERKSKDLWCLHCPELRTIWCGRDLSILHLLNGIFNWHCSNRRLVLLYSAYRVLACDDCCQQRQSRRLISLA